jgi:NDP-sugar pyrophosphorylase family protein
MEAILLAGGKAERLGNAAGGLPKSLVPLGGKPLAAYQVALLAEAGIERVIVSCAGGRGSLFLSELSGLGAEIVPVEEPEPLGRGGGLRFAARARREAGAVVALNGDELLDLDVEAMVAAHAESGAAATIGVARFRSQFGVVELDGDAVTGFEEAALLPLWAHCGLDVLSEEALERLPERGDHERTTFPELAAEGRLRAFRHEGVWLTVNTPKELRIANEYCSRHSGLLPGR